MTAKRSLILLALLATSCSVSPAAPPSPAPSLRHTLSDWMPAYYPLTATFQKDVLQTTSNGSLLSLRVSGFETTPFTADRLDLGSLIVGVYPDGSSILPASAIAFTAHVRTDGLWIQLDRRKILDALPPEATTLQVIVNGRVSGAPQAFYATTEVPVAR